MKIYSGCLLLCLTLIMTACQSESNKPSPTAQPASIPVENMVSSDQVNHVPPKDVIIEVVYFSIGGGTDDKDCSRDYEEPGFGYVSQPAYTKMQPILIVTCGWPPEKKIEVDIIQPNGMREHREVVSDLRGKLEINYVVPSNGQEGTYQFRIKRWFRSLKYSAEISNPQGPIISLSADRKQLYFYLFQPFEKVRVFLYDWANYYYFAGWFELEMNKDGSLVVDNTIESSQHSFIYVAVGEESGQSMANKPDNLTIADMYCKGAPLPIQGIHAGSVVQVITENLSAIKPDQNVSIDLPEGTFVSILKGPTCRDQMYWWWGSVELEDAENQYWIPEGDLNEYFIRITR